MNTDTDVLVRCAKKGREVKKVLDFELWVFASFAALREFVFLHCTF